MAGFTFPTIPQGSIAPGGTVGSPGPASGGVLDTITKFASNPLLQAALAGYLGYAGSPRRGGRGLALEQGGLGALNAFNQAEQAQTKIPLEQAQLGLAQAQTQEAQSKASALQGMSPEEARAAQFGGYGALIEGQMHQRNNKDLAGQFALAHPDPLGLQIANEASNSTKPLDLGELEKTYQERQQAPQKAKETAAHITEMEAQTKKAQRGAEGPASYAAGGREFIRSDGGYRDVGPAEAAIPKEKAVSDLDLEKQADKEFEEAWKTHWHLGGLVGPEHDAAKAAYIKDYMAKHSRGASAPSISAAPPLPAGWKAGSLDASGRPTAIDDKGVSHTWVPD